MKKIIYLILVVFLVALASAELEKQYQLEIINEQGELKAGKIEVVPSLKEIYLDTSGEYKMELVSYSQEILEETYFNLPLFEEIRTYDSEGNEDYLFRELNKTSKIISLPYHENAKEINVYKEEKLKLTISVGKFSKVSGEIVESVGKSVATPNEEQQVSEMNEGQQAEETFAEDEVKEIPLWKLILGLIGLLILILMTAIIIAVIRKPKLK